MVMRMRGYRLDAECPLGVVIHLCIDMRVDTCADMRLGVGVYEHMCYRHRMLDGRCDPPAEFATEERAHSGLKARGCSWRDAQHRPRTK